ncbi:uncharacterized protein LOC124920245 isoform X2 [Impatiens glandulifera]|uniref:uncharacterized protein LOC124920245 isoform X2 n=1 Tax=Impatiens glandulifera TaxID=253017 RepID=UPI001FB0BBA1|nr:uncharacterized protein LOC124920245 isoform X2 [Impatiens glandulifera]
MEVFGCPKLETGGCTTIRKKRSQSSRRPRPDSLRFLDSRSPLSSTPPLDDDDTSSDDDTIRRKELNLSQFGLGDNSYNSGNGLNQKRRREGVLAPANWKRLSKRSEDDDDHHGGTSDFDGNGNKVVRKMKLKVGGVSRTIQSHDLAGHGSSSSRSARTSDALRSRQKLILQDDSDGDLQGNNLKNNISKNSSGRAKDDYSNRKMHVKNASGDHHSEPVRKSKRVPKRRVLDGSFDEDDEDDEIRYLEKLKYSKAAAAAAALAKKDLDEDSSRKFERISRVYKNDYEEEEGEEDVVSDCENEGGKKWKKQKKEQTEFSMSESKKEPALTTRQRALLCGKEAPSMSGASIEFPNGLPPASSSRKQKEKLSEVELQLKKVEAAQRRKLQVEKAARESEAEAIRKILGQDSSRKKREEKIKKRQEELAQEKAATALMLSSTTIRWVMGPNGTRVIFPTEMGLPSIFDQNHCRYPPPRESCAGPSCSNPYKYRDSKSKLPLCSLYCYKAIHEKSNLTC